MFNMKKIGKKISLLRKEHNMTQMELADKMAISYQAVSNWERGNSMPDISNLPELAEIFSISLDELLGEKSPVVLVFGVCLLRKKRAFNEKSRKYKRLVTETFFENQNHRKNVVSYKTIEKTNLR